MATRTLILAPNWVGDTVMAVPVLEALAASGREVWVQSRPNLQPLLRLVPAVERVFPRAGSDRETIRVLRQLGADEAVILPNSFRSAWLPYRAGIPRRWGYAGNLRRWMLQPAVRRRQPGVEHQVTDYDALLERMGVARPGRAPHIQPGELQRSAAARALQDVSVAPDEAALGLFVGAEFGASKRWPPHRFAELADAVAAQWPDRRVVVIAGPKEVDTAVAVRQSAQADLPVVGPRLDLGVLAAVLERLDLLVTNDSGPMHLAAAVGTPCVALFGPTDPRRTSPLGEGHHVLYTGRWCSPCFRRRCPLLHQKCLRDISVDQVLAACQRTLG